jgi:Zn-dependent peptidase ImmA (M78 family)
MAGSISFRLSPSVLEWARSSMGYTIEQAAKKAGVAVERYKAWEQGEKLPTYKQLEDLAENVYKRPLAILLLPAPPEENLIQQDFRNLSNAEISELSPELRLALRKAKRYQLILEEVNTLEVESLIHTFKVHIKDNPIDLAEKFRELVNLTLDEQKSWRHEDSFRNFKRKVEDVGIYVFQMKLPIHDARAFCLTGNFPIVVLNTDDSANGRIFSLFHEVCHILLNINDVFKDLVNTSVNKEYKNIETFCNVFAATFLVPKQAFLLDLRENRIVKGNVSDHDIRMLSSSYNVSNEVIARKLLSLDYIKEDFFWSRKRMWDAAAKLAKEKSNEKQNENDTGRNQGIRIIFEKGRPYVANVVNAYNQGMISSSDLSNYLETKLNHLPKILERLNN